MIEYLTIEEVAETLRVSRMTVYRLIHAGTMPSIKVGGSFRIPRKAFEKYLREAERWSES